MPVVAQGCKPKPIGVSTGATSANAQTTARTTSITTDDDSNNDRIDSSPLQASVNRVQETRAIQTSNAASFLASIGKSGRHPFAGQNIKIGTGDNAVTGYVTDKGLFKKWASDNLMNGASGKYGCPAKTATMETTPGYVIPSNNNQNYVGASLNVAGNSNDTLFLGSQTTSITGGEWNNNDKTLPACGNEGSNVQVIYPAKAIGAVYKGAYNSDKMEHQTDIKPGGGSSIYEICKTRAEDKGRSVFGISVDRCYMGADNSTLEDVQSAGLAYETSAIRLSDNALAKLFYFGRDGTLSLLASDDLKSLYTRSSKIISTCNRTEKVPGTDKTCNGWSWMDTRAQHNNGLPRHVNPVYPAWDCWTGTQCSEAPTASGVQDDYSFSALKSFGLTTPLSGCDLINGGRFVAKPTGTWGEKCNEISRAYWE